MARNKFPGTCNDCGKHVAAGAGHFQRAGRGWIVRHVRCVSDARVAKSMRDEAEDFHEAAMDAAFPFGSEPDMGGWR